MGKVSAGFSMSLDGFIAGPDDDVSKVFGWMYKGDTDLTLTSGEHDIDLKVSEQSAEMFEGASQSIGVLVAGRRLFEVAGAWGGKHPMNVPVVVVTHRIPQEWVKEGSPFTFVTDGVENAIETAKKIAGDKSVAIASASIVQQCIKLGLLEEIHIDLVHILLGDGIPLFGHLGIAPLELESTHIVQAPGVTHLDFRVTK